MKATMHWNDRFYESTDCEYCGNFVMAKTIALLEIAIAEHSC